MNFCELFILQKYNLVILDEFITNRPISIKKLNNKYLSCSKTENFVSFIVDGEGKDNNTNTNTNNENNHWIIEQDAEDPSVYYIKFIFNRSNFTQYLGCPNENNIVYLYTSKNRYTKWHINHMCDNLYNLEYAGQKFDKNDICIILARCHEDIDWCLAYNDITIVYDKGPNQLTTLPDNIIEVKNVGREGHTYLKHIIDNYNNLSKKCIFLQADPFIHNNTVLYGIDNHYQLDEVQAFGLNYLQDINIPPKHILTNYKTVTEYGLNYLVINIDKNLNYISPFDFYDEGILYLITNYLDDFPECKSIVENFLYRSEFPLHKDVNLIRFTFSALFSVTKEKIKKYDVSVYEKLMNELLFFEVNGGVNGYILERLWLYIFED